MTSERLRQLTPLITYPREDLQIEIKSWLDLSKESDRANLAKALLALTNSGGGYVLIGFSDSGGTWAPCGEGPLNLAAYNQDTVNDIVRRYADPTFHCELHIVAHPDNQAAYPVIVVPGGHTFPVRAKSEDPDRKHVKLHAYYIRRPGPTSDQPQSAHEWDDLIRRCMTAAREDLIDSIRAILHGPLPTAVGRQG